MSRTKVFSSKSSTVFVGALMLGAVVMLAGCEDGENPENINKGAGSTVLNYIGSEFKYDLSAISDFQAKPFAQKSGDTLIITDYWALSDQPELRGEATISGDSVTLRYTMPPHSISFDWMPTVETVSKFVGAFPQTLTVTIDPAPKARAVYDTESAKGFRNASDSLVKTVYLDSL